MNIHHIALRQTVIKCLSFCQIQIPQYTKTLDLTAKIAKIGHIKCQCSVIVDAILHKTAFIFFIN